MRAYPAEAPRSHPGSPGRSRTRRYAGPMTHTFTVKEVMVPFKCDVHGWMNGWLVVTESPYVAVTNNSGAFKLTDVPAGSYTVEVWHETLGKSSQKVTVKGKEDAKVNFELKK